MAPENATATAPPDHLATLEKALALTAEPAEDTPAVVEAEEAGNTKVDAPAEAPADDTKQPEEAAAAAPSEQKGIRSLTDEQLVALRRAQITDTDLEGLSDAALAKLADTAAKLRTNSDRAFHSPPPKAPTEASPTKVEDGPGKAAAPAPLAVDVAALADPVRRTLGLDEAEGKVLAEWTKGLLNAAQAAYAPALEQARQDAALANQRVGTLIADSVMDELSGMWPQLKDANKREDVRKHAQRIAAGYEHLPLKVGMTECLRDSCKRVLGDPKQKPAAPRQPDSRERASPAKPTGIKPTTEKPKTADELHLSIVRGLDEGLSERTISKRIGLR